MPSRIIKWVYCALAAFSLQMLISKSPISSNDSKELVFKLIVMKIGPNLSVESIQVGIRAIISLVQVGIVGRVCNQVEPLTNREN